jgi:ABC-2 type transport system permease protein
MKRVQFYYLIWKKWGFNSLQEAFVNRGTNTLFFMGKVIRLTMSLVVLLLIKENISSFSGYTNDQLIVFFLVYQFIENVSQCLFRGVYNFGRLVRNGEFDFDLLKPINPLFRSLMGNPDINDVIFLMPATGISLYILSTLDLNITATSVAVFCLLLVNSFLIATALHIIVLAIAVFTTDVEGVVWMYRDLARLGQFPISAYLELMRFALFFIVPIGMMITIPAELLMNVEPSYNLVWVVGVGVGFLLFSLWLWKTALKSYTSASS